MNGLPVDNSNKQYQILKSNEDEFDKMYSNGELSEEKYNQYKNSLKEWEGDG